MRLHNSIMAESLLMRSSTSLEWDSSGGRRWHSICQLLRHVGGRRLQLSGWLVDGLVGLPCSVLLLRWHFRLFTWASCEVSRINLG